MIFFELTIDNHRLVLFSYFWGGLVALNIWEIRGDYEHLAYSHDILTIGLDGVE